MFFPLVILAWWHQSSLLNVLKKLFFLNALVGIVVLSLLFQHAYDMAFLLFLRSNLILAFVLLLFCDKDAFSIAIAMNHLKVPQKLSTMIFFTTKSIFLIRYEFDRFKQTLNARGFTPKTNFLSYQTLGGFVGILIIKAIERASFLQKAMALRGFCGNVYTLEEHLSWHLRDYVLLGVTIISCLWRQGVLV